MYISPLNAIVYPKVIKMKVHSQEAQSLAEELNVYNYLYCNRIMSLSQILKHHENTDEERYILVKEWEKLSKGICQTIKKYFSGTVALSRVLNFDRVEGKEMSS